MAKYDGLIIPRSYNDYINKSDPVGVQQALALTGVMDDTPTTGSSKPVKSSGLVGFTPVDVVESGNMHAVTSNAAATLAPVNEVTSGNLHSVTSNAVANAMSYSTSEVNTGKTWIDGKPIYRKVLEFTSSNTARTSVNVSAIGIDRIISYEGFLLDLSDNTIAVPNYVTTDYYFQPFLSSDKSTINIDVGVGYYNLSVKMVIEYTKSN